jgi:tetratricopeptide (TPR) repeat protein
VAFGRSPLALSLLVLAELLTAAANPEAEAARWFADGTAAYRAERFEEARSDFVRAYALVPAQETLFDAAQCERRLGEWPAAEKHYQLYLDGPAEEPNRDLAQRSLAEVRAKMGVPNAALSPLRQRLRRVPLAPRVLFGLGVSSLAVGGALIGCGGIILAGDQMTPGTQEHSLYGGQVVAANDFGYVGQAALGVGLVVLIGAVIWGTLATRGGP